MLKHFFIIALRNISKRRLLSFIQIFGLSLGISAFILIAKYVSYEQNWDKFNNKYDRIYRVQSVYKNDISHIGEQTSVPISTYITQNIPEVEKSITIREVWGEFLSPAHESTFLEPNGFFAPSDIFSVFSFELLEGNKENLLDQPDAIVLSETMARKYFADEKNIIGKTILDNTKNELVVTGIMKDIPEYSHIRPDYLRSITNRMKDDGGKWDEQSYRNYVLLKPGVACGKVNEQIKNLYDEHIPLNKEYLYLHPLADLHLNPDNSDDDSALVFFNSLLGILILILALVNFMNLSTAFSSTRSVEIGIRKANGSGKKIITFQFLSESMVLAIISFFIALIFSFICLPFFNHVVNREIALSLTNDIILFLFVFILAILTALLSGFYPAFIASRFNPVQVLKGKNILNGSRGNLSGMKIMVYIQFVLSAILISVSLWTFKQVDYLQNKEVGFNRKILLHCRLDASNSTRSYQALREEILSTPGISNMSVSYNTPLHDNWGTGVMYEEGPVNEYTNVRYNNASPDFIETYQIKMADGRNFSKDFIADKNNCIINEAAVKSFGWNNPIGKWITLNGNKYNVIGVVKNFHQDGVHDPIRPYVLMMHDENLNRHNSYTFQINMMSYNSSVSHIKKIFNATFPNSLFQVLSFEADAEREEIKTWSNARDTFAFFTFIAILIAIVGIFGLVVFTTQRKIKEMGIRKVHGATVFQVFQLVISEFFVLLFIANITVCPVFPAMEDYTPGVFKYQATVWDILIVIGITILIVFISSVYLALKVAKKNPVEALRYE